ncbi:hypothetical protein CGJ97_23700, partial [Vibrio parahaemolyticus]
EISFVTAEIERINEKYLKEDSEEQQTEFEQAIHAVSQHKVNQNVTQKKESCQLQSKQANELQKKIKKEQN